MALGADRLVEPVRISSNWAVATWCGVSVVSYQVCQYYRSKEKAGIKQAQDLMEKKRGSAEKGQRGAGQARAGTEDRRGKEEDMVTLVPKEPQILVTSSAARPCTQWNRRMCTRLCTKSVIYEKAHYLVSERVANLSTIFAKAPYSIFHVAQYANAPVSHHKAP
jgi:hypothetical protein